MGKIKQERYSLHYSGRTVDDAKLRSVSSGNDKMSNSRESEEDSKSMPVCLILWSFLRALNQQIEEKRRQQCSTQRLYSEDKIRRSEISVSSQSMSSQKFHCRTSYLRRKLHCPYPSNEMRRSLQRMDEEQKKKAILYNFNNLKDALPTIENKLLDSRHEGRQLESSESLKMQEQTRNDARSEDASRTISKEQQINILEDI